MNPDFEKLIPPMEDNTLEFLRVIAGVPLLAAIFLLIAVTMFVGYRKHLTLHTKWLLFLGSVILPLFAIPFTVGVGIEAAKPASACGSCHEMQSFVDNMHDPKSDGLAAIHYRNRYIQQNHCYTCHSGYGVFGAMDAKMSGFRHLWVHYVKGKRDVPTEHSTGFDFSSCLFCHGNSEKFRKVEDHMDPTTLEQLAKKEINCFECHTYPHPQVKK